MPAPLILAPPDKIRLLAERRARLRQQEAEKSRNADVFSLIGYEPNCRLRHEVRQRVAAQLGIADAFDSRVTEAAAPLLPPLCGGCPQELFHAATEFSVLFGGSTGGGKSMALTAEAIRACIRHPGLRAGAFRRSYPELRESLLAELAKLEFASALGARWNGSEHELTFPNGSLLMFRYAETLADATRRQGGGYQLLILDELTLFQPGIVMFLESRLRSGSGGIPVLGVRASANPGGPGHGAVKNRYIKPTNYGERVVTDERNRTVRFVPSKLSDNPHMNPEHASDLLALTGQMREAFLEGNWDVFAGQMFPELNRARHVVAPFTPPASWRRYNGVDWGFAKEWAVLYGAVDEDGRIWFYRELYSAGVGEADQARRILACEAPDEHIAVRYADDAMFATRGGDVKPISQIYAEEGVYLTPAGKGPGSRVTGWQRWHSYLAEGPACPVHRAPPFRWETCPMAHFFSTLEHAYRTLADLPHATKGDPEDANTDAEDHLPDCGRYLLINLGGGPSFPLPDEPASSIADELGALEPHGTFARRRLDSDPSFDMDDDEDRPRVTTQLSPFA
jgi:Terminase large subunit, T4likevirus-type, N-terminal